MVELRKKDLIRFALDHAEDLVYEARDIYCEAEDTDADIIEKLSDIIDAITEVKILITSVVKAKKVEEFDEPYEKSEKDCMWEERD